MDLVGTFCLFAMIILVTVTVVGVRVGGVGCLLPLGSSVLSLFSSCDSHRCCERVFVDCLCIWCWFGVCVFSEGVHFWEAVF